MNDLTGMFDQGTELDARLEQASYILKQAADEEGVDLNELSDEDVSGMLANIMDGEGQGGEGGGEGDEGKTAGDLTVADVSFELTKRAAAEGFDLTQVDANTYQELFDKVAAEMTNPEYLEEQQKFAAHAEHMDELGRVAARGFVDEINKLAADDKDDKDDDEDDDDKVKKAARMLKLAGIGDAAKRVGEKTVRVGQKGLQAVSNATEHRSGRVSNRLYRGSIDNQNRLGRVGDKGKKIIGGSVMGAAAGGAAYGGKKLHDKYQGGGRKKKASVEELAYAVDVLRASGFDL